MEIVDLDEFFNYLDKIHKRTRRVIDTIPQDKIEWRHKEGEFSMGDIIRHLANLQRYMFAENVKMKESSYPGHDESYASGYENVVNYFENLYQESVEIFRSLTSADLQQRCKTPGGAQIRIWKWLRSMVEHEIHHRGQIYHMLNLCDDESPPLYGLTSEQVRERSKKLNI